MLWGVPGAGRIFVFRGVLIFSGLLMFLFWWVVYVLWDSRFCLDSILKILSLEVFLLYLGFYFIFCFWLDVCWRFYTVAVLSCSFFLVYLWDLQFQIIRKVLFFFFLLRFYLFSVVSGEFFTFGFFYLTVSFFFVCLTTLWAFWYFFPFSDFLYLLKFFSILLILFWGLGLFLGLGRGVLLHFSLVLLTEFLTVPE